MNLNDYKDGNGNVEVSETLVSDIIDGINANEMFVDGDVITARWESGLQIVVAKEYYNGLMNAPHGALYRSNDFKTLTFPIPFSSIPYSVEVNALSGRSIGGYPVDIRSGSATYWIIGVTNFGQDPANVNVSVIAIGRWK